MNPQIVLVRPIYPRNIGACSRAMANMNAGELILIDPQTDHQQHEARQGAAGAQQRLMEAKTYGSISDCIAEEPDGVRIAFSGKPGAQHDKMGFAERLTWLNEKRSGFNDKPIYFFFGPEDDGLSKEDMASMNYTHRLPTFGDFTSLNLSQAVMLALYIFKSQVTESKITTQEESLDLTPALGGWLEALGFETKNRKRSALTVLKKTILENAPSPEDARVLEAIIQQTVRKLKRPSF